MTMRQFIKKLFVTIIMIGIVLAAVLKVGYILICKVIVVIIFVVLAIQYWVGEDIRKAEEEKRGTWLFTLGFIGLTVLTMLAANIPGQVQRDQYLYLTKEHTEQLEKVLLREATADSERCIQWYEKQMLGIRNNKALGNPAMQTEDERQYKNRIDGKEVYRDPDTCTLRVKELKDGSTKDSVLINGPVGEIIAMRERIFYIDMEDHNVLKSVTYDGRKRKTWTKDPVKQFAVIGEYVICCTEDPELIILDGDMLNEDSKSDEVPVRLVKGLAEIAPVYYALGNHELDYIGTAEGKKMQKHPENSELVKDLTDAGACVLEEGYRDVEIGGCKVRIGGMYEYAFALDGDNSAENLTGNVRDFLEEFQNTDRYKIMLCHRPDSFVFGDASDYWKIDLVISGHDHGGQVVIPFKGGLYGGDQGWFPPYVHGLYRTGRIRLFVTSGLSSEKQKLPRWNNRPEIAVLNVH